MAKANDETAKRVEEYEKMRISMAADGFHESTRTISILKANAMMLVTALPIAALCALAYFFKWHTISFQLTLQQTLLAVAAFFFCVFVHEVIHGLTWSLFCKNRWKSIHLGVVWNQLTPYCHCREALKYGGYILGALMPLAILGLGAFAISLYLGDSILLFLSLLNILGAGGDITISFMALRHKGAFIYDHPTECGFIAFDKKDSQA
jgi:hypothetical protein